MVDLARQAFTSKNFDLAAEIYERTIRENGPKTELLLGLADCFARLGQFDKAFQCYSKASRHGPISPKDLKHLVSALVNIVKQDIVIPPEMNKIVMFDCLLCRNMLFDPVTIPCGHTFCRPCLIKNQSKQCKHCKAIHPHMNISRIKTNVLFSQIIDKCFPTYRKAVEVKQSANDAMQSCRFETAIQLYTSALELAPKDHLLLSNRSYAFSRLDKYQEALDDADHVLSLRPDWPKGFFRRGCALYGLGHYEESVVALLQCLALDSSIETAKDYLSKALHNIILPLAPDDPKAAELQRELNPSLLDQLIRSNFDASLMPGRVTVQTVHQLKQIITDTVNTAANFLDEKCQAFNPEVSKVDMARDRQPVGHCRRKFLKADREFQDQRTHSPTYATGTSFESAEPGPSSSLRCVSAPNSRAGTPVMMKRNFSESSNLAGTDDGASSNVAMETNHQGGELSSPDSSNNVQLALNREDFECSLCYRLLHLPVTTTCGHVFCRPCLDKCLDHKTECPLCKSSLVEYLAERRQAVTSAIENFLETYLPAENRERAQQHEEELQELARMGEDKEHDIPIFVCTLGFPNVACPLHIFEPRYRLMVRQCMESGRRQFGMCISTGPEEPDFSEYGTILEIRDVQFFPDGRSLVDCVGGKRFKVISRGQRDGYNTAKVEYIEDHPPENMEEVRKLSEKVYKVCKKWYNELHQGQRAQILQHMGELPGAENEQNFGAHGTAWHWWMTAVLPIDPRIQLAMIAMTSYKERLKGLGKVLGFLQNKRDSR
ncbi:hypothetical protein DPMN_116854 [Dreissena polymorpha]|uniref:LON peptidase N-terminal domain and RING finger protein 3 n=1 Tax=Dreissena polymorpha TaxID=45954 RepID=A0A9D4KPK0_DREPO|nr:hypothetical protein DPMN_116854 [Dreissena polymorpha]